MGDCKRPCCFHTWEYYRYRISDGSLTKAQTQTYMLREEFLEELNRWNAICPDWKYWEVSDG